MNLQWISSGFCILKLSANLPGGLEVRCWPNKPVVVASSLGSGETVSVSRIAPQLSCTLNSRLCSNKQKVKIRIGM